MLCCLHPIKCFVLIWLISYKPNKLYHMNYELDVYEMWKTNCCRKLCIRFCKIKWNLRLSFMDSKGWGVKKIILTNLCEQI